MLATKDRRILEALLSAPPELSGIVDAVLAGKVEDRYLEVVYPTELAELEAMDSVVAEAETAVSIAYNELRQVADMHPHDFETLMRPIETHRPWLTSDSTQVVEVGADGKASYRKANEEDIANGVRYENFAAWQAAQGLAEAA